ncbi:MAG: DUF4304 domain-containing protein, partial [Gammaproteobacteria bacterium]|nr:DUF4304 domain-containing protein [Gammaproteobacteria bacterium]
MPAEVTAKINAVVAEWISPALQAREFRSPECIRVFELQRGKYNKDSRGEFTINLGVYHPSWVQATATIPRMEFVGPVTDRPAEQYCFLRERLDELAFAEADADEWDSN